MASDHFVYLDKICLFLLTIFYFGFHRNLLDVMWEAISNRQVLSLYQGLGTKNLQSFIAQFIYFYGYSYFKRLYLSRSHQKTIGTKANLIVAAAAGACTAIITQVLYRLDVWNYFNDDLFLFLLLNFCYYFWCFSDFWSSSFIILFIQLLAIRHSIISNAN